MKGLRQAEPAVAMIDHHKSSFQNSRFLKSFADFPKFTAVSANSTPIPKKQNPHF
jgi:hypothetical protein